MPQAAMHKRRSAGPDPESSALTPPGDTPLAFASPPRYDRPVGAVTLSNVSPVTNSKLANVQQMQSGSDELSGVHASSVSGGDHSREQGVGRAPGWQWPFNFNSQAFNLQSLDRWAIERTGAVGLPADSGANPYVGVPEAPYSPVAAIDSYTMYYERDPDQHRTWATPVAIPQVQAPSYSEQAVLPV